jgi:tRNA modification GTPase
MLETGTIVAVVTPEGRGGLAVVRLSGPRALDVARRLLPPAVLRAPVSSHRARLARIRWPGDGADVLPAGSQPAGGTVLDQALVLPLLAPRSYTGEDTVEFFCHGGLVPARLVVAACRAAGARAAGPGEFTRRAFLAGRLTLTQAEAVADLVAAEHATGARAALAQLEGGLAGELAAVEGPLRSLLADLEGSLEFDDTADDTADAGESPADAAVAATLARARAAIDGLLQLAPAGRQLRDGVQVVLRGPTNAGKSSLFNALLAEDRALVDPEAGTTRDVVSAACELEGLRFVLHDTAGLRDAAAGVEARGMERTVRAVAAADLVLDLEPVPAAGAAGSEAAGGDGAGEASAPVIPVATKADLAAAAACQAARAAGHVVTSAHTGEGLADLRRALADAAREAGVLEAATRGVVLQARHRDRLRACARALEEVQDAAAAGLDVQASLLAGALQELGQVTGRVFTEQLLDQVFGRFCVGK